MPGPRAARAAWAAAPARSGGAGGIASGTTASARGRDATATAHQIGGAGGYGYRGAKGGTGSASSLTDAVTGIADGGVLTLIQKAEGGRGGFGTAAAGGAGANGVSALTFNETGNPTASTWLDGRSEATGGLGGGGTSGGKAGVATAAITLTNARKVDASAVATGGVGGSVFSGLGNGTGGATASASSAATTSSVIESATARASAHGGAGGYGAGTGNRGGNGGNGGATAQAFGRSAYAYTLLNGGKGGKATAGAIGGAGANTTLTNTATGGTTGGTLTLRQVVRGGDGGEGEGASGGNGGAGMSNLTFNDATANTVDAAVLSGFATGYGGAGGSAGGSFVDMTGARKVTTYATAFGGSGGKLNSAVAATGGPSKATSIATSIGLGLDATAEATAVAQGGAGTTQGTANATASATTAAGQQATASATGDGSGGQANGAALTHTAGFISVASASATAQVGSSATALAVANAISPTPIFYGTLFESYGGATALPNAGFVTTSLGANLDVKAALGGPSASVLATGMHGAVRSPDATGSRTYASTTTWTVNTLTLSGDLVLGLLDTQSFGAGFSSLGFSVTLDGVSQVSQSFTTLAAAQTYFDDNAVNLGDVANVAALTVTVDFTLVSGTAGTGFAMNYILGTTNVEIDLTPPGAPGTPDLAAASDTGALNADNITKTTTPTFTGSAEAGATVSLFDGATQIGSALADGAGLWAIVSSALTPGAHAITARATDAAGNTGVASAALSVTIDTSASAPTGLDMQAASDRGTSNTDNVTNLSTPNILGKGEIGATVTLFRAGAAIGSAQVNASGNWIIKTSALTDGTHTLRARQTDLAGNVSALSATPLSVTIDTKAPAAPVFGAITTTTASGTAEASAKITVFDGATQIATTTATTTGTWAIPLALGVGSHGLSAKATDLAGNTSAASATTNVAMGTVGPDVLFAAGANRSVAGAGNDIHAVDDAGDLAIEAAGEGYDTVHASVGYALPLNSEIEFLAANAGITGLALRGNGFANTIFGGAGGDTIIGDGGADTLYGWAGPDVFALLALSDSTVAAAGQDVIGDYSALAGDLIGLGALDADSLAPGDQAFTFIGAAGFSGLAGELRSEVSGGATLVSGDVTGDGSADFAIRLLGTHTLTGASFSL